MGLTCSNGAYDGPYGRFHGFRIVTLYAAGGKIIDEKKSVGGFSLVYATPDDMKFEEGFDMFFTTSDCEGVIGHKDCKLVSQALTEILPNMENADMGLFKKYFVSVKLAPMSEYTEKLKQFISGCDKCFENKEDMLFE